MLHLSTDTRLNVAEQRVTADGDGIFQLEASVVQNVEFSPVYDATKAEIRRLDNDRVIVSYKTTLTLSIKADFLFDDPGGDDEDLVISANVRGRQVDIPAKLAMTLGPKDKAGSLALLDLSLSELPRRVHLGFVERSSQRAD